MPKILWKSLHLCFPSNLTRCYSSPCLPPSAAEDPSRPSIVLINNFNLLYHDDDVNNHHHHHHHHRSLVDLPSSPTATTSSSATSSYEADNHDISPDLSAAFASRRFFFSSPGRSNAITDSPETRSRELSDNSDSATTKTKKKHYDATMNTTRLLSGGTALKQHVYSPDPFTDFRRSMQEMIDAAMLAGDLSRPDDGYDFLNELLLSYLSLNPTDTHKFVIRAFSDILVTLLSDERRVC